MKHAYLYLSREKAKEVINVFSDFSLEIEYFLENLGNYIDKNLNGENQYVNLTISKNFF